MEGKLSLSVSRVPARRFVYYTYSSLPKSWNEGVSKVNSLVESIPTLTFAHQKTVIWLNGQKGLEASNELVCRVGREVIGHYDLNADKDERFGIIDEKARECFRFNLGEIPVESITFDKIFELEKELRKKTTEFGRVEDGWRIIVNDAVVLDDTLEISTEIQFFSKY